ncbi:hypothetical protein QX776_14220 [Alteromonadaceae bacterium BrNp21-10]|nr:hypothetical protein [Alteromonadaceae bacterium BrNp21-10]
MYPSDIWNVAGVSLEIHSISKDGMYPEQQRERCCQTQSMSVEACISHRRLYLDSFRSISDITAHTVENEVI